MKSKIKNKKLRKGVIQRVKYLRVRVDCTYKKYSLAKKEGWDLEGYKNSWVGACALLEEYEQFCNTGEMVVNGNEFNN